MREREIFRAIAVTALGMTSANAAFAAAPGAGAYGLRLTLVWLCAAVAAAVYAATVYALAVAEPRTGAPVVSRRAELLWAVVPAVILIALAAPAVEHLAALAAASQPTTTLTVSTLTR